MSLFPEEENKNEYRVLARKYRPKNFDELIGQEVLVRTLSNAIKTNRIAHAFLLTGVRGIGKTTTARIIARALNCEKGPTIAPCGECENCIAISQDRHMDVIEMDAASRTGVDDVRELIDGVRYRPTSARFKVYIIDEVHMLSKNAFNALLKTLEEPPPSVKFIFATTEVNKLPVTVLSRCQRFDLRRVDAETLAKHLTNIAQKENIVLEPAAAALLSRVADGSVRDSLSLLDQAIALAGSPIAIDPVRSMLGMADRSALYELLDNLLSGNAEAVLKQWATMHQAGADAVMLLQDLLSATHALTKIKVGGVIDGAIADTERKISQEIAAKLSVPQLTRIWQMLLKGLAEVQAAPQPASALEMILIRVTFAADLPPISQLIEGVQLQPSAAPATPSSPGPSGGSARASYTATSAVGSAAISVEAKPEGATQMRREPESFLAAVELFAEKREMQLYHHLMQDAELVKFAPGLIEIHPLPHAPRDLSNRVGKFLTEWCGSRWLVTVSSEKGQKTLAKKAQEERDALLEKARQNPIVQKVIQLFPGAEITKVKKRLKQNENADAPPTTEEEEIL